MMMTNRVDIPYGPHAAHRLDLYFPPQQQTSISSSSSAVSVQPLIAFIHGGAWRSEDKAHHAALAARLAARTLCTVAVPNYRLSPHVQHPYHAHDVLRALAFLIGVPLPHSDADFQEDAQEDVDTLPERGTLFDPTRLFFIGHSCGAHILTSIFLRPSSNLNSTQLTILIPPPPLLAAARGIALSEGLYDIDALIRVFPTYQSWFVQQAFGHPPPYTSVSPVHYILHPSTNLNNGSADTNGDNLHWLIVHSPGDTLVDLPQSETFFAHLTRLYFDREQNPDSQLNDKDTDPEADSHDDLPNKSAYVDKDWTTLTTEHNEMLKTEEYSNLVGDWLVKHK